MTSMYRCDKCGQMFNDYEDAYKHENSHWTLHRGWTMLDTTLDDMTEYKEGQEEPNIVHLVFTRWDSEKMENVRRCGKFKLISSYDAPLEITND